MIDSVGYKSEKSSTFNKDSPADEDDNMKHVKGIKIHERIPALTSTHARW